MHEVDYLCGVELGIGDILGGLVSSESGPASNPGYVPPRVRWPLLPSSAPHQLALGSRTASKLLNPVEHQQPFWKAIATAGRNSGCCGVPPLPMLRLNVAAVIAGSGGFWRVDRHRGGGGRHSTPPGQVRVLRSPVPCLLRSPQGLQPPAVQYWSAAERPRGGTIEVRLADGGGPAERPSARAGWWLGSVRWAHGGQDAN